MKHYLKPETESFQTTPNTTLCASANVGVTLGTMKVKSFPEPNSPILVFALMLSGMFLLPSCKNGNGDVQQPSAFKKGEVVTITTNPIGAGNKTPRRVHIEPNQAGETAQLVWTDGDHLRVIVPESSTSFPSSDFVLTAGANSNLGTFTGTMPADGSEFFLAYPCGIVTGDWIESPNTFKFQSVSIPEVQDFTVGATTFNPGLMPVVGYGKEEGGVLTGTTTIVGGALRVKLKNSTGDDLTFNKIKLLVHKATLSSGSTEPTSVRGTYAVYYDVESGAVTPSGTSADNKNIVLNLSQEVTLVKGAISNDFYFVMLAPLYFKTKTFEDGSEASFTVYLDKDENRVATTSFNYNIDIQPGEIVEGTLVMTE